MAKFLKYGLAKGLSVVHDYNVDIERAFRFNELEQRNRQEYEQKAQFFAEKLKKPVPFAEITRKELEPFYQDLFKKVSDIHTNDPNWMSSIDGMTRFNELADQVINNPIIIRDQLARQNYEAFQKDFNSGQLTLSQTNEEMEKWNAFANQEPGDNIPAYTYRRPEKFDMIADIDTAVKLLIDTAEEEPWTDTATGTYGTRKKWDDTRIKNIARARYNGNVEGYNLKWDQMDDAMKKEFYSNDPIEYVASYIRSMLPKNIYSAKAYTAAGLKRLGFGGTGTQDYMNRPYMLSIYNNKTGSTNDPHVGEFIPTNVSDQGKFLNTSAIPGLKFTKDFDDPNAVYKPLRNKNAKIFISKQSGEWKRDKAGNPFTKVELMMAENAYDDNFGTYFSAGTDKDINLNRVDLNPLQNATINIGNVSMPVQSSGSPRLPTTYKEMFGTDKYKFVYFDAWVPMSEQDPSARLAYDQAWSTEGLRSNVAYGEQPNLGGEYEGIQTISVSEYNANKRTAHTKQSLQLGFDKSYPGQYIVVD